MPGLRRVAPFVMATLLLPACANLLAAGTAVQGADGLVGRISGPMPPLAGPTLSGGVVAPSDTAGKVVVVSFWASWCAPCRREQPGLQSLWEQMKGSGVQFVGVDYEDAAAEARSFVEEFRVTYPSIQDPGGRIGAAFGIPFLPVTVLVDATGQMRYRLIGAQEPEALRRLILSLRPSA